ncbi:MAG TPA: hypothetical protein VII31_01330 [Caldimonas sp.]
MIVRALHLLAAALIGATLLGCASTGSEPACDRACLVAVTERYFDALGDRAASRAPLAASAHLTENGAEVTPATSVFASARPMRWRQVFADPVSGQTSSFAVYEDDAGPVLYAVRLKVVDRQVVESEAMVNRRGAHPFFAPQALTGPNELFAAPVPAAERLPRGRLRALANAYFDGIEQHSAEGVRFHADCKRLENGVRTTDNPEANLPRSCASGMQMFTYIPTVRDRSYPVIDDEHNVVFGWGVFDMPGLASTAVVDGKTVELPARVREPKSMRYAEAFKVVDGRLHTIQAFIRYEPLGARTGWRP